MYKDSNQQLRCALCLCTSTCTYVQSHQSCVSFLERVGNLTAESSHRDGHGHTGLHKEATAAPRLRWADSPLHSPPAQPRGHKAPHHLSAAPPHASKTTFSSAFGTQFLAYGSGVLVKVGAEVDFGRLSNVKPLQECQGTAPIVPQGSATLRRSKSRGETQLSVWLQGEATKKRPFG